MDIQHRDNLIDVLCKGPDRHIADSVKARLRKLKNRPNEDIVEELLSIIDDAVYASLVSDFTVLALNATWLECGGNVEEMESIRKTEKYLSVSQTKDYVQ